MQTLHSASVFLTTTALQRVVALPSGEERSRWRSDRRVTPSIQAGPTTTLHVFWSSSSSFSSISIIIWSSDLPHSLYTSLAHHYSACLPHHHHPQEGKNREVANTKVNEIKKEVYNTQKRDYTRMVDDTMESNEGGERKLSVDEHRAMLEVVVMIIIHYN